MISPLELAQQIAAEFAGRPEVTAVALAGSRGLGSAGVDVASDIDVYVYTRAAVPLAVRHAAAARTGGAARANFDLSYWGPGDLWIHAPTGIEVDVVYFEAAWMEDQLARVVDRHQPSLGYTTCFWHTVRQSQALADPAGWLAGLQQRAAVPYPEPLRRNIIAYNHPVLRGLITSYAAQVEKAVQRRDLVSVNHRLAALLASYFDIVFAVNGQLHPGEKRQLAFARQHCPRRPADLEADLEAVLLPAPADLEHVPARVTRLLDHLDELLAAEGLRPAADAAQ